MADDECWHEGRLRASILRKVMANMPQRPTRLKRRRPHPSRSRHVEQQPGRHGQSASPKIADLGLPQADRVEQAEVQHPHLATAMAGSVPETTSQDAQQARVLNNAGSEGPSVNHLGRRVKDQPAAPSFNAFNSTVAGPAASSVDPVENANPRTKKPPKPACSILRTRRLPCLPAAASPGRADGFTSVELHNPGKIIKTAVAYRKKRASMARQKQMVHSFGALTLASGPLPTPFDSPRNDRPSASVIPPQAPKGGSVTAAGAIRADCEPQTMHLHNSPRIYDIDASAQTSPGRVCAPGLATARLASISAPAWTLTDSSMEQELGTEGITFENDNTRTRQSQTRPDNSATRMYFHARSKPDVDHDFQHSYDKTIFWPHYA